MDSSLNSNLIGDAEHMARPLFRQQALNHMQHRLHGDVLILPNPSHTLITVLLLFWVAGLAIWLFYGQYARQETVQGWLEPPGGVAKHFAQNHRGIVKSVLVEDGQAVSAGQALLIINGDRLLSAGISVEETLITEYQTQLNGAKRALNQQAQIFELQSLSLNQRISAAHEDLKQIDNQGQIVSQRADLVTARINRLNAMQQQGHIAEAELDNLHEQQLAIKSEMQALTRDKLAQNNRIVQLQTDLQLLPQE